MALFNGDLNVSLSSSLNNDDVLLKVLRLGYYKKYLHCHFSEISKLELGLTLKSLLNNAIKILAFVKVFLL